MSLDDRAEEAEQRFRDMAIATKRPELKHCGACYNCSEPLSQGVFCDSNCRDDYDKREAFNKGRI